MSRNSRILMALAAFAITSVVLIVTSDRAPVAAETDDRPDVIDVFVNDPEMNDAIAEAQASVRLLVERLPNLRAKGIFVSIKFPLSENGETEHVWMDDPIFDGEGFSGYLASTPVNLPSWAYGDQVRVVAGGISDWIAVDDQTLYGGYTLYVLHRRMSPEERRVLEKGLGLPLPDGPIIWD